MPHNHRHVLADWHKATPAMTDQAIAAAAAAHQDWSTWGMGRPAPRSS